MSLQSLYTFRFKNNDLHMYGKGKKPSSDLLNRLSIYIDEIKNTKNIKKSCLNISEKSHHYYNLFLPELSEVFIYDYNNTQILIKILDLCQLDVKRDNKYIIFVNHYEKIFRNIKIYCKFGKSYSSNTCSKCPICQSEITIKQCLHKYPCGHIFHWNCFLSMVDLYSR